MGYDFKDFSKLVALDEYGRTFDKSIDDWDEKYNIYVNLCDIAVSHKIQYICKFM